MPDPISAPSGAFLQVSKGVELVVDCHRPVLDRVVSLRINGQALSKPGSSDRTLRMATSTFISSGGDGYSMLTRAGSELARNPANAQRAGGIDSNITAAYLKQSGFNVTPEDGFRVDAGRVTLLHCSVPIRPSN